jgi:lysophospholipase L1-like esterase
MNIFEKMSAWALLILASICFCIFLLELYARFFATESSLQSLRDINDHTYYPRPYVMSAGRPGISDHNVLGYRGKIPTLPKPKEEFRVFLFGGSVVYNDTFQDSSPRTIGTGTLPYKIQTLFSKNGIENVKIYSFGAVSSNSRQDLVRLVLDASGFQPDLILFYFGYNELDISVEFRPNFPHRHILYDLNPAFRLRASDTPFFAYLALSSEFLRLLFPTLVEKIVFANQLKQMKDKYFAEITQEENDNRRLDAVLQNLLLAKIFSQSIRADFLPILQPILSTKTHLHTKEAAIPKDQRFREFFEKIRKTAEAKKIDIIDFSNIFETHKAQIFKDSVHLTNTGNDFVAEKIYSLINKKAKEKNKHTLQNPDRLMLYPETRFHPSIEFFQR